MSTAVRVRQEGLVRVLSIDNPPVNGLGAAVRSGLKAALDEALADEGTEAIVLTGEGAMFCAGADIREFGAEPPAGTPALPDVIDAFEASTKPVVAAIHGVAAGGGLELALGCHGRLATSDARVGLPEVTLGIIPGAGGTQRLPRLIGVAPALDLIVSGKLVAAAKAAKLGRRGPRRRAETSSRRPSTTRFREEPDETDVGARGRERGTARSRRPKRAIAKKARGFEAPFAAIEAVRAAFELPAAEGYRERARDLPEARRLEPGEGTATRVLRRA